MFKSLIIYRIAQGWAPNLQAAEEALAKAPFMECGATHWTLPRFRATSTQASCQPSWR